MKRLIVTFALIIASVTMAQAETVMITNGAFENQRVIFRTSDEGETHISTAIKGAGNTWVVFDDNSNMTLVNDLSSSGRDDE